MHAWLFVVQLLQLSSFVYWSENEWVSTQSKIEGCDDVSKSNKYSDGHFTMWKVKNYMHSNLLKLNYTQLMTGAHVETHTLEQCHVTISECSQNSDHTWIMYSCKCMHRSNRVTSKSQLQLDTESTALFYLISCCTKLQTLTPSPWTDVHKLCKNYILAKKLLQHSFDCGPSTALRQLRIHDRALNGLPRYFCVLMGIEPPFIQCTHNNVSGISHSPFINAQKTWCQFS